MDVDQSYLVFFDKFFMDGENQGVQFLESPTEIEFKPDPSFNIDCVKQPDGTFLYIKTRNQLKKAWE